MNTKEEQDNPGRINVSDNMDLEQLHEVQTAQQQPATATETKPAATAVARALSFRGAYFEAPNGFNISISVPDPLGRKTALRVTKRYDLITDFTAFRVTGTPYPEDPSKMPDLTFHGRFESKGGDWRVTVTGREDIDALKPVLKGKLRKNKDLAEPLVFSYIGGLKMPNFGFNAYSMFINEGGETKTLFLPAGASLNDVEGDGSSLADDFLEPKNQ